MDEILGAIKKTLAYADIFDYPLTFSQLHRFLILGRPVKKEYLSRGINQLRSQKKVEKKGDYFFLEGRGEIVSLRQKRERWSLGKFKIAKRAARWLRLTPWIKMVGITGALSMNNADENDDLDLLIVAAKNRLWLARLVTVFLIELVAKRRKPGEREVKDKICLNMFLEETALGVPLKERNLFTAHEVVQLRRLWARNNTYHLFLARNLWAKRWLANSFTQKKGRNRLTGRRSNLFSLDFLSPFERLAGFCQLFYMRPKRTTEVIEARRLLFHQNFRGKKIMLEYQKKLEKIKGL